MKRFPLLLTALFCMFFSVLHAQDMNQHIPSEHEIDATITKMNQEMSILKSEMKTFRVRIKINKSDVEAQGHLQHHTETLKTIKKELAEVKATKKALKEYVKSLSVCEKRKTKFLGKLNHFNDIEKRY